MNQPTPIYLPSPSQKGGISLTEAIARRRSIRDFTPEPISQSQLSQILWAAQGKSNTWGRHRTVPSAGATYPLEIFVAGGKNSVEEIDDGVYHYDIYTHSLTLHHRGDVRLELARAALGQRFIYEVPVDIVICALYHRTLAHYGSRGERYIHIEVGHAAQNLCLQATVTGLGAVTIGAFYDEQVTKLLNLPEKEQPLYIIPVGRK